MSYLFSVILGMVTVNFHAVAPLDKITFAKDAANDCQPTALDNAFICKFSGNFFLIVTSRTEYF